MTSVDDYHTSLMAKKEKLRKDADSSTVKLVMNGFKTTGIAIAVWLWGYLGMSVAWIFVVLFFHIVSGEVSKQIKSKRKFALHSMNSEKKAILSRVDERQSWIYFPELERAEWLNKMIKQLWPVIADYAETLIMTTIQDCIQAYMPANLGNFKFTHVDMGDVPVRVEWVKVYIDPSKKEEVTMDLNIKYEGDASIKCEVKGIGFGIKTLQMHGNMRVVMNPLISEVPIIGGVSAFFLNTPDINFDMLAAANLLDLPVIKKTIRDIVSKVVSDNVVLPRRIPIKLHESVDLTKIRYPPADGLVVVHVLEAKDLRAADVSVISKSKSDPYCCVTIGNQEMRTQVVSNKLNPSWDKYFQAVVDQRHGQSVDLKVFDKDQGSANDDSLGSASLDIDFIAKKKQVDVWLPLANVPTGSLHVRALWMEAGTTMQKFKPSAQVIKTKFANAIMMVVVESATGIPPSPNTGKQRNPYVVSRIEDEMKSTSIKNANNEPEWNENFNFFISDPQNQQLDLKLMHKGSSKELQLGHVVVPVNVVLLSKDLTMVKTYSLPEMSAKGSITVRFVLRLLNSSVNVEEWADFSSIMSLTSGTYMKPAFSTADESTPANPGGLLNFDFGELEKPQGPTGRAVKTPVVEAFEEQTSEADFAARSDSDAGGASGGGIDSGVASGGGGSDVGVASGGGGSIGDGSDIGVASGGGGSDVGVASGGGDAAHATEGGLEDVFKAAADATTAAAAPREGRNGTGAGVATSASAMESLNSGHVKTPPPYSPSLNDASAVFTPNIPKLPTADLVYPPSPLKEPSKYGQLQLTLRYSSNRSTLVLVVHQCRNLIPCDKDNLADPYVRTYLLPDRSSDSKRKTKIVKNSLNPVFDETFEWALGNMELPFRSLEVAVKNDVSMFSRGRVNMGTLIIKLSQIDNPSQALTQWYDLEGEE